MKPNIYRILSEAVQDGIQLGMRKAEKHEDGEHVEQYLFNSIMLCISEYFSFEDP